MAVTSKDKKSKLSTKYRFAIIEDESHKNLFVFRSTRLGIILAITVIVLLLLIGAFCITAYTPIKRLIPGYPSLQTQSMAIDNASKVDSLEREIKMWAFQLTNIQRIISGNEPFPIDSVATAVNNYNSKIVTVKQTSSKDDSLLREEITKAERFDIVSSSDTKIKQIEGLLFFPPVTGVVTENYNRAIGHPYIDIAVAANSMVYATLDGTIISAGWNDDTGYTIQIQHSNDLISVYKHNVKLLKQTGDRVSAGTPISLAGDAGKLSTGSHLHFELWHKGEPIDPILYIKF